VVAGTATTVAGRVSHRQRETLARRDETQVIPAPADTPHASPSGATDFVARLQQLADLKATGALTDKEFAAAKTRLLKD
jgi:hypothetical protein